MKVIKKSFFKIFLIFLIVLAVFSLTKVYFSSDSKNIVNDKKIIWTKDWVNHTTQYSGSELVFAITKTSKISIKVSTPSPEPNEEVIITAEGISYNLSSPNINKKELTIYLDKSSYHIPTDIRIQTFCTQESYPCNLHIDKISVDNSSKIYKSITMPSKTLAILGDSISSDFGSKNYSKLLADNLGYQLHNSSLFGSTLTGNSKKSALIRYKKDIIDYKPDVVLIFLGTNDALEGIPADKFINDYKKIVEDIKNKTKSKVFIAGLLPGGSIDPSLFYNYNISIENLALSEKVNYIPASEWLTPEDFMDSLHPSLEAQAKLAEGFKQKIISAK